MSRDRKLGSMISKLNGFVKFLQEICCGDMVYIYISFFQGNELGRYD